MTHDTRSRMIAATARLLQDRGYHGTSLSDILDTSGAPRGSLYFHFPGGKDQLAIEATRAAVEQVSQMLQETLSNARSPAQGVRTFIRMAADMLRETDYTFGCPVSPLVLDANGGVQELAELCRQAFEEWVGLWRQAFVSAGMPTRRAQAVAVLVESSIEGALLIARAYREVQPLLTVGAELESVVNNAVPRRRRTA